MNERVTSSESLAAAIRDGLDAATDEGGVKVMLPLKDQPILPAEYAAGLRDALTVMVAGGLADDGRGGWYVGDQGPYGSLDEAETFLDFRGETDTRFIIQQP